MVKRVKCPKDLAFPPCYHTWAFPPTEWPLSAIWRFFRVRSGWQQPCNQATGTRLFTLLEEVEESRFSLPKSLEFSDSIRRIAGPHRAFQSCTTRQRFRAARYAF